MHYIVDIYVHEVLDTVLSIYHCHEVDVTNRFHKIHHSIYKMHIQYIHHIVHDDNEL